MSLKSIFWLLQKARDKRVSTGQQHKCSCESRRRIITAYNWTEESMKKNRRNIYFLQSQMHSDPNAVSRM